METRKFEFFQKIRNWRNWILSVPRVSVCREKKSPWLRQYESYISNWYVNGKVFTSTTTWEPKNFIFFSKKIEIEFDLYFDLCWPVFWHVLNWILWTWHSIRSQHAPICRHRGCIVIPLRVDIKFQIWNIGHIFAFVHSRNQGAQFSGLYEWMLFWEFHYLIILITISFPLPL